MAQDPGPAYRVGRAVFWTFKVLGQLVLAYIAIVEAILVTGFVLRLFGANPSSDFVAFVYRSVDRIMEPFRGIFEPVTLGTTGADVDAVLDTSLLFAMIVYLLLFLGLQALLRWLEERLLRLEHERRVAEYRTAQQQAVTTRLATPAEVARLDELDALHERGQLTDEEFAAAKAAVLRG